MIRARARNKYSTWPYRGNPEHLQWLIAAIVSNDSGCKAPRDKLDLGSLELPVLCVSLVATLYTWPLAALTRLTPSPSPPTVHPPTPRLIPSRLSCNLFLGTGGGPAGARGSSAISFLLALMERSLALVSTDKRIPYYGVFY